MPSRGIRHAASIASRIRCSASQTGSPGPAEPPPPALRPVVSPLDSRLAHRFDGPAGRCGRATMSCRASGSSGSRVSQRSKSSGATTTGMRSCSGANRGGRTGDDGVADDQSGPGPAAGPQACEGEGAARRRVDEVGLLSCRLASTRKAVGRDKAAAAREGVAKRRLLAQASPRALMSARRSTGRRPRTHQANGPARSRASRGWRRSAASGWERCCIAARSRPAARDRRAPARARPHLSVASASSGRTPRNVIRRRLSAAREAAGAPLQVMPTTTPAVVTPAR